jgi:Ca-activated chloride channel family protein
MSRPRRVFAASLAGIAAMAVSLTAQDSFRFRSGVELVNVTATVTDDNGRFVPNLDKDDFTVFDDGQRRDITHFSNERVPVSLGILLDSSGSMTPDKMAAASAAIDRLVNELLGPDDEMFFMEFANAPRVLQAWTSDRRQIRRAVDRVIAAGGTALYDAVAHALPMASAGKHQKKAILVISDGNDTDSRITVRDLRNQIRESEVLVYALGVDGSAVNRMPTSQPPIIRTPIPVPFPIPGTGGRRRFPQIFGGQRLPNGERVNGDALRQITDDSGGRTEIVRGFSDLGNATARIADELSKQYYLGYASTGEKDGKWHAIRVEVRDRRLIVRARKGYIAS